jgi:hypothetical protein
MNGLKFRPLSIDELMSDATIWFASPRQKNKEFKLALFRRMLVRKAELKRTKYVFEFQRMIPAYTPLYVRDLVNIVTDYYSVDPFDDVFIRKSSVIL